MTQSEKAAASALRLLTAKGGPLKIRRVEKDFDPVTGEAADLVKIQGTFQGVVLPLSSTAKGILAEADNHLLSDLVAGKIRFVLVAAKGAPFEPVANDLLGPLGGEQFSVVGCTPLSPVGVPIIYKIAAIVSPASPDNAGTIDLLELERAAALLETLVEETLFELQ